MIASALREPFKKPLKPLKHYQAFRHLHNKRKQRLLSQQLNELRDQLYYKQCQIPLPTSWLIDQLIENAIKQQDSEISDEDNYPDTRQLLVETLQQIIIDTQNTRYCYTRENGKTPLFPNEELMDETEVKEFAEGALKIIQSNH